MKPEDYLIKIVRSGDVYGSVTEDPLDRIYYHDMWATDCPEDLTLSRDIGSFIVEINNLRSLLVEHGIDPSG